jgi:DHA1 family bicyclomycin/chloramphenicol resistance-like MFS transporter
MLIMGIAPIVAPILGSQLVTLLGWRSVFWVLAGFGALELLQAAKDAGGWPAVAESLGVGVAAVMTAYRVSIGFELAAA